MSDTNSFQTAVTPTDEQKKEIIDNYNRLLAIKKNKTAMIEMGYWNDTFEKQIDGSIMSLKILRDTYGF